jgi:DNA-binding transcriptional LysR family regulator
MSAPLMSAVEIRHVRYAIAAADHHSFRKAAEALRLKQSTLSRAVRELEDQLGVSLFERSRGGVQPTQAGTQFLRMARSLVDDFTVMLANARAAGQGTAGQLTIGFYSSLAGGNLLATVLEYGRRFPAVNIRAIEAARGRLLKGLKSGAIDIAIVSGDPPGMSKRAMALWSERIFVALPENHPLAAHEVVSWIDLKGETFLLSGSDPGSDIYDLLIAKLATPGDQPRVVTYDVSNPNIKGLVSGGLGVTLISDSCLSVTYTGVVYREARDGNGSSRIGYSALWEENNANPALTSFLKLLRERYPVPANNGA